MRKKTIFEPQSPQRKKRTHRERKRKIYSCFLKTPNPQYQIILTQRHKDHREKNVLFCSKPNPQPFFSHVGPVELVVFCFTKSKFQSQNPKSYNINRRLTQIYADFSTGFLLLTALYSLLTIKYVL